MCGITALISPQGALKKIDTKKVLKNFDNVRPRGPDTTIVKEVDENVLFVFHRLAIIDPDHASDQPLQLDDLHLICNGEIYNYQALIKKYGFVMKTKSDCEVILHMYKKFGIDRTVRELDAEFVFVLYDQPNKKVYLSRDPIGVRPMYTGNKDGDIYVASEAKAIHQLTDDKMNQFLPGYYYEIVIGSISSIGSSESSGSEERKMVQYYSVIDTTAFQEKVKSVGLIIPQEYNRICAWVNYFFTKAVEKRLMSDRPIGCLLSGGLDSSLVVSIMSRYIKNINVFTIGLEGSVDVFYAKIVAEFLGLENHHVVKFTTDEGINSLSDVIKTIESYDTTTIRASTPQYLLAKYISAMTSIRVILSGEGSDELMAGYMYSHDAPDAKSLYLDTIRLMILLYLYDLLRTDRTLSSQGLEARPPFLDLDFIALIFSLNPEIKMCKDTIEKKLLRDSFSMQLMETDEFMDEMNKLSVLDDTYVSSYVEHHKFEKKPYLPDNVLYRSKSAFSDAVSSKEVSWYKSIQKKVADTYDDDHFKGLMISYKTDTNPPRTKEELYYREIFESHYKGRSYMIPQFWMPMWQKADVVDPSATVLDAHKKFNNETPDDGRE